MKCHNCAGQLTPSRQEQTHEVSGRAFHVTSAAARCRKCGAVFLEATSLDRSLLEVACELALQGPMIGESFRYLRKALGMHAVFTAGLLDVTAETISRWENGQRSIDQGAWLTLGSLVLERAGRSTDTMERINSLRAPAVAHQPMKLDASRQSGIRRTRVRNSKPARSA